LIPLLKRDEKPLELVWQEESHFIKSGELNVYDNPIIIPPIEVVKRGNKAVLRYFEKIAQEGQDYIYEAKLILVGEGSAGKTSLQVRLQDAKAKLPQQDKRTRGIQIADWSFKTSKGRPHIAHIWDFGGQDVYYPVHRFFLTENAVFVLLASTRQTTHNFDYWIPTIFQFGGKSPIILGQTCHDGNKVAWNDLGYYIGSDNFNIIKTGALPYQELNLTNKNEGLAKIKKTIVEQLTSLPHYGKGVPKTWVTVRDKIAAMAPKTACIPFSKFKELCRAISSEGFADAVAVDDCAGFLHSIGVVLWYADIAGLKDWVVLQPEWAMKAVYKIIDDADIQKRRGVILAKDFKRLWSEGCYEGMHDVLKQMLEVFKIAFPKKHPKGDYIIPARLLSMPAEDRWQIAEPCLRLEYKYEFMPRGMVNQLSAELSRYIIADEQVWNDAVNFKSNDASCQVTEDFYNRFIRIVATGKDARALVMLVMNGLQDITDGYRGVTPQIIVPCTCKKCEKSTKPITFEYDRLLEWSKEREMVTCNNSGDTLRIDDLLYHVGLRNPEKEAKIRGMKKIFISYSKHDEEFKEEFHSHLVTLWEQGLAYDFNCKQIDLGAEWDPAIQQEIDECDIMICLVSKGFLNTPYIRNNEVNVALGKGKQVIPVIIKPCDWENSNIGQLYAPLRGKPVSLNHEKLLRNIYEETTSIERDAHWTNIIKELREKVFKA
jgi:internalin A